MTANEETKDKNDKVLFGKRYAVEQAIVGFNESQIQSAFDCIFCEFT